VALRNAEGVAVVGFGRVILALRSVGLAQFVQDEHQVIILKQLVSSALCELTLTTDRCSTRSTSITDGLEGIRRTAICHLFVFVFGLGIAGLFLLLLLLLLLVLFLLLIFITVGQSLCDNAAAAPATATNSAVSNDESGFHSSEEIQVELDKLRQIEASLKNLLANPGERTKQAIPLLPTKGVASDKGRPE